MGLNDTPASNRVHIGFFGRRNAGKSSIVNAVTGQDTAIVSSTKGTTTDPVSKSMELLPLGPVVIIDTPGLDDVGALGELRIRRTQRILNKTDIAVLVVDMTEGIRDCEQDLIQLFQAKSIPYLIVYNKLDLCPTPPLMQSNEIAVSALKNIGIHSLKEKLAALAPKESGRKLVGDLVKSGDVVILVTPIDSAAPKGRLILPQQQTIRDLLEAGALSVVVRETELTAALNSLSKAPSMVITDSQAFQKVSAEVPMQIPLTSFSILMARYKGFLETAVHGAAALDTLKSGDAVLICEGCTHHRQCDDIGTVKLPRWLKQYTHADLQLTHTSGNEFPEDLSSYSLIIHCGGCMLNEREMLYRMKCAKDQHIPFTNYGIAIAHIHGILKRSLSLFPDLLKLFH